MLCLHLWCKSFLKKPYCEDLFNINWRESMKASILCVQIVVLISICPFHILLNWNYKTMYHQIDKYFMITILLPPPFFVLLFNLMNPWLSVRRYNILFPSALFRYLHRFIILISAVLIITFCLTWQGLSCTSCAFRLFSLYRMT